MLERKESENNVYEISKSFAIRIVNLYKYLKEEKSEFIMSKNKMNVALKEATESAYWIDLLHETHFLNDKEFDSLYDECSKIIGVLTKIVKATKQ